MPLNVYTSRKYIPENIKLIERVPAFFDSLIPIEECDFAKEVIEKVDHSKWYSNFTFTSRFPGAGNVGLDNLSNGAKTVLSVYYHPELCFTLRTCAANAAYFIWTLSEGNVFMPYLMELRGSSCDIVLNGDKHYYVLDELWRELYDKPEILDGWDEGRN